MALADLTDLIGHWRCNGNGNDAHGSNNLSETNTQYADAGFLRNAGEHLQAIRFDTTTRYLSHADNADLSTGDVDFMVAFLARWRADDTGVIAAKLEDSSNREWLAWVAASDDVFHFKIYDSDGNGAGEVTSTSMADGTVTLDKWYLVFCWHDATANTVNIQVYDEDGYSSTDSSATTGVPSDTSAPFYIGSSGLNIDGQIDVQAVSYWIDSYLSQSERDELWNDGYLLDYPWDGSPFDTDENALYHYGEGGSSNENQAIFREAAITSVELSGTRYQVATHWNQDDYLVVSTRTMGGSWTNDEKTSISLLSDGVHYVISIGTDPDGYVHLCYRMHNDSLNYIISDNPLDSWGAGGFSSGSMLGTNENSVTYSTFFNDPADGTLYFMFRDGGSGNGDLYFYEYDESTTSWSAAAGTGTNGLLIDGSSASPDESPYWDTPAFSSDWDGAGTGYMWLMWMWREEDAASTNHDYQCMKWDGTNWYQDDGASQTIPATPSNDDTVISIAQASGLLNQNSIDIDSDGYPHVAYIKDDGSSDSQLYHNYYDGSSWTEKKLTSTAGTDAFSSEMGRPCVIIDRSTDTVRIYYRDDTDGSYPGQLLYYQSNPNYTSWTQGVAYGNDLGRYEPLYDRNYYLSSGNVQFYLAPWWSDTGQKHITIFDAPDVLGTTISLTWTDNAENEDGFELQRRTSGGTFSTVTDAIAADAESYNDTEVPTGATYDYRIRALSTDKGDSEWSNTDSETV